MRRLSGLWRRALVVMSVLLLVAAPAFAQATSTLNGRILDQDDAVLPGVTVTVTSQSTGVARTTVSNAEGVYYLPGLDPGVYDVSTELPGFAPVARNGVTLGVNATITLDFSLSVAGVQETLTVTGDAPLIEVTQSKVASSIEATELQNLPMITRSISGLMALLPGAAVLAPVHRTKENVGSVSYGGGAGANVTPTVDGADNRDSHYGGPLLTFTTEGIEQFQLATSQFTAADGRSAGAALTIVTKSGTNVLHGSGFLFGRDRALAAKDYFTRRDNLDKAPFSRQQFGGSIGGPIMRNRIFFFGAAEQVFQDTSISIPDRLYNELDLLVSATAAGLIPPGLVNPNHPRFGPIPSELTLYTIKANGQLSNNHSVMGRYAGQRDDRDAVTFNSPANDLREPENSTMRIWSAVGQHNWVLGNRGLNQLTGQVTHLYRLSDVVSAITGEHYRRDFPNVPLFPPRLAFPSVNTGAGGAGGTITDSYSYQIRDDVSLLTGTHTLKMGASFISTPKLGAENANEHFPTVTFFDDPSVILSNSNGRYPQGFQTPGIVRQWLQGNRVIATGTHGARQAMAWFQDDWRATPRLTLNLGVRYDVDINYYDQRHYANNATRLVLEAIGHPFGNLPKASMTNISPRVGFAYDLSQDGRRVVRGGYGIYFDQYYTGGNSDVAYQNHRPLGASATLTNTAIGTGQLAGFRFGVDPLPAAPTTTDSLPRGATGQWLDPDISDPYTHQAHIGYAQELASNTTISVDYTHVAGRNEFRELNLNPIVNGQRVLAPDFVRVFGIPNVLNAVNIQQSNNKSRYDALTIKFQRRLPRVTLQAHYTLAGAYAYGGSAGSRGGAPVPQDAFDPLAPGEWGPTGTDERHRVVAMGVFELPYGIQLSPVFQAATARPYNLTAGADLNADGNNNDRYVDPLTGEQMSINAARGDNTVVLDLRSTKFVGLGGVRRIGLFLELFNVFNTANFGSSYTGNSRSSSFREPTGFIPGIGYARQVQLGARFLF